MAKDEYISLRHIEWSDSFLTEKPTQYSTEPPEGKEKQNFVLSYAPEQKIADIRGSGKTFELDRNGFTIINDPLPSMKWDKESIQSTYLPRAIALVHRAVPDATEVVPFDFRLRSSDPKKVEGELAFKNFTDWIAPFNMVHVDQSGDRAKERVIEQMGDRACHLLNYRWRSLNVWRPIEHPVQDSPLALCDSSSVAPGDLVAADHYRESFGGEALYMLYNRNHRWYYLSEQTKDEVLVFKIHDSDGSSAQCCPHTAFIASETDAKAKPRESIEVRFLVFSAPPLEGAGR
ncbi:methyltransferase CmcJ, partial [Metarhizium majus ARSEF 297]